jgi:hypothetical protein
VATAALRRGLAIASALGAAGVIVVLALHGERPGSGLARYEAAGIMLALDPDRVTAVEVRQAGRRWRFERGAGAAWLQDGAGPAPDPTARAVEDGLRFLHGSAPQRTLTPAEVAGIPLGEYGLAPPRYEVRVQDAAGAAFVVEFGALNSQGLAQYARVTGRDEILLLPGYVGRAWEAAIGPP